MRMRHLKHSTYGIVADMFEVVPVLTKALNGGEIPVVDMTPKKSETSTTETSTEAAPAAEAKPAEAAAAPKKMSLKERLAAKKSNASAPSSTPAVAKATAPAKSKVLLFQPMSPHQCWFPERRVLQYSAEVTALRTEVSELTGTEVGNSFGKHGKESDCRC